MGWSAKDVPDQSGRTIVVTGANGGIGFEAARALTAAGAHVVLACRDPERGRAALEALRGARPGARAELQPLDLASLASVRDFAKRISDQHARLDVLVNNAGVMAIPRRETADGFEMQIGTNHLGHFALTGLLLPRLLGTPGSRVVNVSSTAHRIGRIDFDDLHGERRYQRWAAYGQSKLANLLFSFELARRLAAAGRETRSVACHPGWAATNLQTAGPRMDGSAFMERLALLGNRLFSQDAAMGALPTLYAATHPDAASGDYIGPDRMFETWGHPTKVGSSARSRDAAAAARLWDLSQELTGVRFEARARPSTGESH